MVADAEFQRAETAGARFMKEVPHAVEARFVAEHRRLRITLSNGVEMAIPVGLLQGLGHASDGDLAQVELTPLGTGLHWEALDADLSVEGLAQGIFGSKAWMASIMGRSGGSATSDAKAAASRANGRKGGRPRKTG